MSLAKKITQIVAMFFLVISVASCKDGCFEAEQFDSDSVTIESYPEKDGIDGVYDNDDGGQTANWHETGLRSNGQQFVIQIQGAWTPWNRQYTTDEILNGLPVCDFCAKKSDNTSENCICYKGKSPADEKGKTCATNKDNSELCTCSKSYMPAGSSDENYLAAYGQNILHFPLNYYEKNLTTKIADKQSLCKYQAGMGVYIGLFGSRGVTNPKRLYHLLSHETVCNITPIGGECKTLDGKDHTRYIFRSENAQIFMKDDNAGNNGTDTNTADDEYHSPNEVVKVKIYDVYYNDNYGKYNLEFLRGVGQDDKADNYGILEFLVGLVENSLLGKTNSEGVRENSMIEYMYKSIVQDSGFIKILDITLSLYVAFFGFAVLMGTVEISKKELMMRILKIGCVILFTTSSSWNLYNEIVVGFFYDSMNYVIGIFSDLSAQTLSKEDSTLIINAKLDRATDNSSATRFSFIDTVITMMFSEAATAKIFGLFFASFFGVIYILAIYALIFFFIYVMFLAALVYVTNLIKLVFVLCLGPIFMCFMLFNQTSSMFKNWIGFLGGRSLEMIIMFVVLYNFVTIIDVQFRTLLNYKACISNYSLGYFMVFKILKSEVDRSLAEWTSQILSIAALIYITKMVMEKIPEFAGGLVSIGGIGVGAGDRGSALKGGGLGGGAGMLGAIGGAGLAIANTAFNGTKEGDFGMGRIPGLGSLASAAMQGGTYLARASGVAGAVAKISDSIPGLNQISSPRAMMRNQAIDKAITAAKADAAKKDLKGSAADSYIRGSVTNAMRQRLNGDSQGAKRLALAGLDDKTVQDRLDKKLIQDPLKDFIKAKSAEIKSRAPDKIPDAKQFRAELRSASKEWAKNNLSAGAAKRAENHIDKTNKKGLAGGSSHFERDLKKLVKDQGRLKTSEAAKKFKDSPELQNKYMQSLQGNELKRQKRNEEAGKSIFTAVPNLAGRALDALNPTTHHDRNVKSAMESFTRQTENQQRGWGNSQTYNPLNRSNALSNLQDKTSKILGSEGSTVKERSSQAQQAALRSYLADNAKKAKSQDGDKKAKEDKKRDYMQKELHKSAVGGDLAKKVAEIKQLEKNGKFKEALDEKKKLLEEAKKALLSKTPLGKDAKNQPTLFEKSARLSYLQNKFGVGGKEKDAQRILAKAIGDEIKEGSSKILSNAASNPIKDSKQELKKLENLQSALFLPKINDDKLAGKISEKMEKELNEQFKKWGDKETGSLVEKEDSFKNRTLSEIGGAAAEELSKALIGKDLSQDYEKEIVQNHEEISREREENLKHLDEISNQIEKASEEKESQTTSESTIEKNSPENLNESKEEAVEIKKENKALENLLDAAKKESLKSAADAVKKLEEEGKFREALEQKKKLLEEAMEDFSSKKQSAKDDEYRSFFSEKLARVVYLHDQFGVVDKKGEDTKTITLKTFADEARKAGFSTSREESINFDLAVRKKTESKLKDHLKEWTKKEDDSLDKKEKEFEQRTKLKGLEPEKEKSNDSNDKSLSRSKEKSKEEENQANIKAKTKEIQNLINELNKLQASPQKPDDNKVNDLKKEIFNQLIGDDAEKLEAFLRADKDSQFAFLNKALNEKLDTGLEVADKKIGELTENKNLTPEEKTAEIEKVKESVGLVATSFEIQFGSSIKDALPKAPDVGLKASNVLLGVPDSDGESGADSKKEADRMAKNQAEGRLRVAKVSLKIAEFELDQLRIDPEKNKQKINDLESKIGNLQNDRDKFDRQIKDLGDAA